MIFDFSDIVGIIISISLTIVFLSLLVGTPSKSRRERHSIDKDRNSVLARLRKEYGDDVVARSEEEALLFAQVDSDEARLDRQNYHNEMVQSMFWGNAPDEEIERYIEKYFE